MFTRSSCSIWHHSLLIAPFDAEKGSSMPLQLYLSIPIKYCSQAQLIESALKNAGLVILNPCHITPLDMPKEHIPAAIARQCIELIESSKGVILFTDYYGRDCSAEVGYAIARQKPIFPITLSGASPFIEQDWMIKPFLQPLSYGIEETIERITKFFSMPREGAGKQYFPQTRHVVDTSASKNPRKP